MATSYQTGDLLLRVTIEQGVVSASAHRIISFGYRFIKLQVPHVSQQAAVSWQCNKDWFCNDYTNYRPSSIS